MKYNNDVLLKIDKFKKMNNIISSITISTIESLIIGILLLSLLFLTIVLYKKRGLMKPVNKFEDLFVKIREEIRYAVAPKFFDVSPRVNDLIDLAVEVWRVEQRILKSSSALPELQFKGLENSVQKLKRYLSRYDMDIIDYKNQKYNEGLNLDILSIEKDSSLIGPIIKETIEPTITCKGQVIRKAKIILANNS